MRLRFIILAFLISITPVAAQSAQLQKGFDWLTDQAENGDFRDPQATGMAALAFKEAGGFERGKQSVDVLLSQDDTCWPSSSCKVKDTSLALLALDIYSEDTDPVLDWFEQAQTPASAVGEWYLEVITSKSGSCTISYGTTEKILQVNSGHFPSCQNSTFLDLNNCLEPGLLNKNPSIDFDVNCANLGAGTKVAMVYNTGTSYYLISEAATTQAVFPVSNACFGETEGSACSTEPSLYANWGLEKARSRLTVTPWLEDNFLKTNEMQTALMYLSSGTQEHIDQLTNMQSINGDLDEDILTTALAALAFKEAGRVQEFDSAKAWLITKQRNDGSWGNTFTTATVLYAMYDGEQISFRGISAGTEGPVCNEDGFCGYGENSLNCAFDCFCGDNTCDTTESSSSCPADCDAEETFEPKNFCGDGVCNVDESNDTCPADCPKEGGFPWFWMFMIIILLAIAFLLYYKFYKKKDKPSQPVKIQKPSELRRPIQTRMPTRAVPRTRQRSTRTESELEKSLREAKKLLRK